MKWVCLHEIYLSPFSCYIFYSPFSRFRSLLAVFLLYFWSSARNFSPPLINSFECLLWFFDAFFFFFYVYLLVIIFLFMATYCTLFWINFINAPMNVVPRCNMHPEFWKVISPLELYILVQNPPIFRKLTKWWHDTTCTIKNAPLNNWF